MSGSGLVLEGKIDINSNGDGTFLIRAALTGQSDQQIEFLISEEQLEQLLKDACSERQK